MSKIFPGDLQSLRRVEALAGAEEWTALAVLASSAGQPAALGALAAAADREAAFRWMWAIVGSGGQAQQWEQVNAKLADGVRVPQNLRDAVRSFVLSPVPSQTATMQQPYQQRPDLRRTVQVRLLEKLDPNTSFARNLARDVLEADEDRFWPELRHAAFDVLGASKRKSDRKLLLEFTERSTPRERLRSLLGLKEPYSEEEQEKLVGMLREALPIGGRFHANGPNQDVYWGWARELAARLPVEQVARLLDEPWASRDGERASFFGGDFVRLLGVEKLKKLLASDLGEPVLRQLLADASGQLSLDRLADIGRWAHKRLDPDWSQPLRNKLSTHARHHGRGHRSEASEGALRAMRDFALSCDDSQATTDFAACVQPGEARDLAEEAVASETVPRRLGRVAGALLLRDAGAFEKEVTEILLLYPDDADRAAFLSGFVEVEQDSEDGLDLRFLVSDVLGYRDSMGVLAEAGHGSALVRAATQSEESERGCLSVLEAAIEHLTPDSRESLRSHCRWSRLDLDDYRRYVATLVRHSPTLLSETAAALESLSGPEAGAIRPEFLEPLLAAALKLREQRENAKEAGTAVPALSLEDELGGQPVSHLGRLLDHRSRALRELALRWAEGIESDEGVVKLLTEKRESTRVHEERFSRVLETHARELVSRAKDATVEWEDRAESLELACMADEKIAREAAFELCESHSAELRKRAAATLAATESFPEEEEELRRLLEDESDAEVGELLEAAMRKISSGDAERAIENLRALLGLAPDKVSDARALLPDQGWDSRFVECVDRARRSRGGEPGDYVNALNVLAELLVDETIVERHDADPDCSPIKKAKEVEAIRNNSPARPDCGHLIQRQNLLEAFPWFAHVMVLRGMRGAHPAPAGSTEPVRVGEDEADHAERLFQGIVSGWTRSIAETRSLRP